jgi:hypothetical protein
MTSLSALARAGLRGRSRSLLGALSLWGTGVLACTPSLPDSAGARWAQLGQALSGAQIERGYSGTLALITVTRAEVGLCTATLLAPNLVATARHCVAPTSADSVTCSEDRGAFSAPYPLDSLWVNHARTLSGPLVSFGLLPETGGSDEFVSVAEVFVPDTDDVCGGDLALLRLSRGLDASEATPLTPRLDLAVERGDPYTAIGFGDTPAASGQGARRSRSGLAVSCTPEDCDTLGAIEATEFEGGDGVCSGDSGGPALDVEDRVVGIASRSQDCTDSAYSALFGWRDFIRKVGTRAAKAGNYPAPAWLVAAPPAPPSLEPPTPEAAAALEESATPESSFPPPEGESAAEDANDLERRPLAASNAAGGSGCSLAGWSRAGEPQPALVLLFGACLGALAWRRRPRSAA